MQADNSWMNEAYNPYAGTGGNDEESSSDVSPPDVSVCEEVDMEFVKTMALNGVVVDHGVMTYITHGVTDEIWDLVCQHNTWMVQANLATPLSETLIEKVSSALKMFKGQNSVTKAFYAKQNHNAQMKDGWFHGAIQTIVKTYSVDKLIQYGKTIVIHNSPQINDVVSGMDMDERIEGDLNAVKTIYKNSSPGLKKQELESISIQDALDNVADIAVGPGWAASNVATVQNQSYKWMVSGGTNFYNLLKTINADMIEMYGYSTIPIIEVSAEEFKKIETDRHVFDSMFEVLHSEDGVQVSSPERDERVAELFPHYSTAYRELRSQSKNKFSFKSLVDITTACAWMGQKTTLLASYAAPIVCCNKKGEYRFLIFDSTKRKLWPSLGAVVSEVDYGKVVHRYMFNDDILGKIAEYTSMMNNALQAKRLCLTETNFHPWIQSKETQFTDLKLILKGKVDDPNLCVIRRSNVGAMAPVMDKLVHWDHIVIDPLSNNVYLTPIKINTTLPNRFVDPQTGGTGFASPIGLRLSSGLSGNYSPAFHVARTINSVKDACAFLGTDPTPYIDKIIENIPRIQGTGKTVIRQGVVTSFCELALSIRDMIGTHYVSRPIGGKTNGLAIAKAQELLFSVHGVEVRLGVDDSFNPYQM